MKIIETLIKAPRISAQRNPNVSLSFGFFIANRVLMIEKMNPTRSENRWRTSEYIANDFDN